MLLVKCGRFLSFNYYSGGHFSCLRTLTSKTDLKEDWTKVKRNSANAKEKLASDVSERETLDPEELRFSHLADYRFVYPEFLPDPKFEFRHKIREKLERSDMLKRRSIIDIPEFYVGSIVSITSSDPYAPGKFTKFVGICTNRTYAGLRATFTLRNIVDQQGVEIMYDLYNPTIKNIEVLRLEKRLDDTLEYLRDAPHEYSIFPFDMEPELIIEGEPIKINPIKVPLKPPPWSARWERYRFKGVIYPDLPEKVWKQAAKSFIHKFDDDYDLMKEYRQSIPEEDQVEIWQDVDAHKKQFHLKKQQWKRKILQKAPPKK